MAARAKKLLAHDLWGLMVLLNGEYGGFTIPVVSRLAGPDAAGTLKKYVEFLTAEGVLRAVKIGPRDVDGWTILRKGETPPLQRAPSEKLARHHRALWIAMRNLGSFAIPELRVAASTAEDPIAATTTLEYVQALKKHGIVAQVSGTLVSRYRLVPRANTGPCGPVPFDHAGHWFDMNLMRTNSRGAAK